MLTSLRLASYADVPFGQQTNGISKNLQAIRDYKMRSNLFHSVYSKFQPSFSPKLRTLHLVLAHIQLDLTLSPSAFGFPHSQKAIYSHPRSNPIFKGQNHDRVNINLLMHTLDFFKYHLTFSRAQTLYRSFSGLNQQKRPRCWNARIRHGLQSLGSRWYGTWGMYTPSVNHRIFSS